MKDLKNIMITYSKDIKVGEVNKIMESLDSNASTIAYINAGAKYAGHADLTLSEADMILNCLGYARNKIEYITAGYAYGKSREEA